MLALWSGGARGDPSAIVWSGGTVRPMSEHPAVRLVSERLIIEPRIGTAQITAHLDFQNARGPCTVQMGFPTLAQREAGYHLIEGFVVEVDGTSCTVDNQEGEIHLGKRKHACAWRMFRVPFTAGQKRRMRIRYDLRARYGNYDMKVRVPYVLATGGSWLGPIGDLTVEVRLGDRLNFHALSLTGDGQPLPVEERDDSLFWRCRDYDGKPALLWLRAGRGPASVTTGGPRRSWPHEAVRWRRGRLLVELGVLAEALCAEPSVKHGAKLTKETKAIKLTGWDLPIFPLGEKNLRLAHFVDPEPALLVFGGALHVTRNEKGDAAVTISAFDTNGYGPAETTALFRDQKTAYRLRALEAVAERWPEKCPGICEPICRRTGEDPAIVQKCLALLASHHPQSCLALSRKILGRKGEATPVVLWAAGYLIDAVADPPAPEQVMARLAIGEGKEAMAAIVEAVLATAYDPVVRAGAAVLAALDPEAARDGLAKAIPECKNWLDAAHRGRNAGLALRLMKAPGARETLIRAVRGHEEKQAAEDTLVALGFLGDDEAIPFLVKTTLDYEDRLHDINWAAARALARLGTPGALHACVDMAEKTRNRSLAWNALRAIDEAIHFPRRRRPPHRPREAPGWARSMTVESACREAVPFLERLARLPDVKQGEIAPRLAHARLTLPPLNR